MIHYSTAVPFNHYQTFIVGEAMSSHFYIPKPIVITSLFSIALLSSPLHDHAEPQIGCTFEGMVGTYPIRLHWFCNQIKKANQALQDETPLQLSFKNRIILYGPPGNGKRTVAHKIAQKSDSKLFEITGSSIVQQHVGQGAQNIIHYFENTRDYVNKNKATAIVFIDELDTLTNTIGEGREEHLAATQQLWTELDKIKSDPRIAFIGTTNRFNKLDNTFLDRFGCNKVEIPNPDEKTRREVLIYYKKLLTGTDWNQGLLKKIVGKTKGFNIRNLEDLVEDAQMISALNNKGVMTEKILLNSLKEIKLKTKEKFSFRKIIHEAVATTSNVVHTLNTGYILSQIISRTLGF